MAHLKSVTLDLQRLGTRKVATEELSELFVDNYSQKSISISDDVSSNKDQFLQESKIDISQFSPEALRDQQVRHEVFMQKHRKRQMWFLGLFYLCAFLASTTFLVFDVSSCGLNTRRHTITISDDDTLVSSLYLKQFQENDYNTYIPWLKDSLQKSLFVKQENVSIIYTDFEQFPMGILINNTAKQQKNGLTTLLESIQVNGQLNEANQLLFSIINDDKKRIRVDQPWFGGGFWYNYSNNGYPINFSENQSRQCRFEADQTIFDDSNGTTTTDFFMNLDGSSSESYLPLWVANFDDVIRGRLQKYCIGNYTLEINISNYWCSSPLIVRDFRGSLIKFTGVTTTGDFVIDSSQGQILNLELNGQVSFNRIVFPRTFERLNIILNQPNTSSKSVRLFFPVFPKVGAKQEDCIENCSIDYFGVVSQVSWVQTQVNGSEPVQFENVTRMIIKQMVDIHQNPIEICLSEFGLLKECNAEADRCQYYFNYSFVNETDPLHKPQLKTRIELKFFDTILNEGKEEIICDSTTTEQCRGSLITCKRQPKSRKMNIDGCEDSSV